MHQLIFAMAAHLSHCRFVACDAVGDAVGEVQLALVADFSAVEVVESIDVLGQAPLLGTKGLPEPTSLTGLRS